MKNSRPLKLLKRIFKHNLPYYRYLQRKRIERIRQKGYANVVFTVGNLPMWRAQGLYDLLRGDPRFRLYILLVEFTTQTKEENERNFDILRAYFKQRDIPCFTLDELPPHIQLDHWDPDIIFYVQPYTKLYPKSVRYTTYKDRLTAYIPYGLMTVFRKWNYNKGLHNTAWRVYLPTEIHRENARYFSDCEAENVRVVGEPHADDFLRKETKKVWKGDGLKKRIIWAPHFRINPSKMFYRPSFLWTHKIMLEIADYYKDSIQFAFKPHPRLYSELCKHPDWGPEKAKAYYELWATMPNTQLETGEFVDLFKESDALIHDCGSFVAEYMFTKKPCMFLTHDSESVSAEMCRFGKECFSLHHLGQSKEDILRFIEDIVIAGHDNKLSEREEFFSQHLLPPNGNTTAMNMYLDITQTLFGEE